MTNKKKLLIFAHYYYPDVASTAQILQDLAEGMSDTFDITVICGVPSYDGKIEDKYKTQKYNFDELNGVRIIRVRVPEFNKTNKLSRVRNIVSYFFNALGACLKSGKQDYIFTISQPPILGGLLGVCGKWLKHAKMIYNIQDFNPEQIMAVNYYTNKLVLSIMMCLDKFSCLQSDLIITVGRDLVETVNKRFKYKNVPKTVMINNWIDEKQIYPLPSDNPSVVAFKEKYGLTGKFVIMYSGNIGLYYDLENILKVIAKFKDEKDVAFAFVGEGSVLPKLKAYKKENQLDNVIFIPYQKKEDLIYSLNAADVHWCVNAKGIKGVSCPSKFYGIAAVNKLVLGVLEKDSEICELIKEIKCGLVSEPNDYSSIKEMIKAVIEGNISYMDSRNYVENNLTKNVSIDKYKKEIINL